MPQVAPAIKLLPKQSESETVRALATSGKEKRQKLCAICAGEQGRGGGSSWRAGWVRSMDWRSQNFYTKGTSREHCFERLIQPVEFIACQ
jgi:hypothetical protein